MAACFHFMFYIYRCRLHSFSSLLKLENIFKASSMSRSVILDKIGFCSLLCVYTISYAEKIVIIKQNKAPVLWEMSSKDHWGEFELGR